MPTGFKYYAFISYSRKDSKAAAWLQKRLEWFRFPVKLVPEDRRPPNARYVRPIYRDKTSLEVTDEHYWTNIRRALEESRYLIVLCSPHAAASEPVNMEVTHFLETHGDDASLVAPVIVSGNVTSAGADAALCPALRALGDTLIGRNLPTMVPDAVTAEQDAWEQGFVSLVSYLLHLERTALGDHIQRETKRQARVLRRWLAAVGVLTVIAAVAGVIALWQRGVAEKRRAEAVEANERNQQMVLQASRNDYATASEHLAKGEWRKGIAYLGRSLGFNPNNEFARFMLWQQVVYGGGDRDELPIARLEQNDPIESAAFSPDGRRIVTASVHSARIWDAKSGKPLTGLLPLFAPTRGACFSADGTHVLTFGPYFAKVWNVSNGEPLGRELKHKDEINSAVFSPDGTQVLTASGEDAQVWDVATGEPRGQPLVCPGERVWSAAFSSDGTRIVAANSVSFRIWDTSNGNKLVETQCQMGRDNRATFSPDGTRVLTASEKTAQLWRADDGKPLGDPLPHRHSITASAFSPDGRSVVTSCYDGTAQLWDAITGKRLGDALKHDAPVSAVTFSPDGTRVITTSADHAKLWEAATGRLLIESFRHQGTVTSAAFSPDGAYVVTTSHDRTALLWDLAGGKIQGEPFRSKGVVQSAAFDREGKRAITASWDKAARVWDVPTGDLLVEFPHSNRVRKAEFSPDGARILTASGNSAWIGNIDDGKPLPHTSLIRSAQFSRDGRWVVTSGADYKARVWDAASGTQLAELQHGDEVNSAVFSPDATHILTACTNRARMSEWPLSERKDKVFEHPGRNATVNSVASNHVGSRIVTASSDGSARVWDVSSGNLLYEPLRHPGSPRVNSAKFSADDTRLLTASDDKSARLWDARGGKPLGEPYWHQDSVLDATFNHDGTRMLSACGDGTARLWEIPSPSRFPVRGNRWPAMEMISGWAMNDEGELRLLSMPERLACREQAVESVRGSGDWERLLAWWLTPPSQRTASPVSNVTRRQLADRHLAVINANSVREAMMLDPGHPLIQIAAASLSENATRAEFLRNYGVQRLPADAPYCGWAAARLVEQKDFPRALKAADKALALDPKNADAQKARAAAVEGMKSKTPTQ